VHDGHWASALELGDAANIAGGDHVGPDLGDIAELSFAQLLRYLRLQKIVGPGRTAAEMALRYVEHLEPGLGQQRLWSIMKALPVLHRTRGMVGNAKTAAGVFAGKCPKTDGLDDFRDIAGERRDACSLFGISRVFAQHEAVILDGRTAARGIDHDGVERLSRPSVDVRAGKSQRGRLLPQMVDQRAATAAARRDDDLAAETGQKPDRRFIYLRRQHPLGAARQ